MASGWKSAYEDFHRYADLRPVYFHGGEIITDDEKGQDRDIQLPSLALDAIRLLLELLRMY